MTTEGNWLVPRDTLTEGELDAVLPVVPVTSVSCRLGLPDAHLEMFQSLRIWISNVSQDRVLVCEPRVGNDCDCTLETFWPRWSLVGRYSWSALGQGQTMSSVSYAPKEMRTQLTGDHCLEAAQWGRMLVLEQSRWSVTGGEACGRVVPHGEVIGFYNHKPRLKFRDFSNFCVGVPYDFWLPVYARHKNFPETVRCAFSEKAIMLTKAAMMHDRDAFERIANADAPAECKRSGRKVRNFDEELLLRRLKETAFEVALQKFESNPELQGLLLSTGSVLIAEATANYEIFGIGLNVGDPRVQIKACRRGKNVLGEALMTVRECLKARRNGVTASALHRDGEFGEVDATFIRIMKETEVDCYL